MKDAIGRRLGIGPKGPQTSISYDFGMGKKIKPQVEGNINLNHRPQVKNPDGSTSTVRSISIDEDGKTVLIPTVVGNKVVSNDEAIGNYKKTGQHLGKFDNSTTADIYAKALHRQQAKRYGK